MRIHFTVVLLVLFSHMAWSQEEGTITGYVKAKGKPIPGATVRVLGTEKGAVTDSSGFYQINNIKATEVTVEVRSIGFRNQTQEIAVPGGARQDWELDENSLGLDEVVVTGTMQPTYVSKSPIKVDVVTSRYFNKFTPAAASSIVDGVKLVNGVQEVTACGVCFTNSISINGLPGPYTAVLMDGTPIYGNLAAVYGLNGIPNMIVDRFEVIKGPNSTLYGSEAVAGVINIITKDPEDQPALSVDVMGTTHMESFGNLAVSPKIGKSKGWIGLNYAYINDFDDRNNDGFGDMINLDRYSLFTKWDIHRPGDKKFTIAAKYYYEDRRNGVEAYVEDRNYRQLRGSDSIYGESIYTKRAELFGTYEMPGGLPLRVDYSMSTHLQDSYYGADYYKAAQNIGFANFIWDDTFGNHSLVGGATVRYQYYDDNTVATTDSLGPEEVVNRPNDQFIPGVFIQDEWEVLPSLTLLSGMRLDHYTHHGPIFSPRLNMKYKPGTWTTVRLNFGTGFRIVNLFTEDHAFVTGQREVEITESLNPERSYNLSLNLNHVYTLGNSQGTIDVDGYYTYFTNKIIPDYDTPGKIVYANANGHAVTQGIGANVNQQFDMPLGINIGFTFQDVTQTEQNEAEEWETTDVNFAPKWSGIMTANYLVKKYDLTLAYTMRMTGKMALPEVYDLDEGGDLQAQPRDLYSSPFSLHNVQVSKDFNESWSVYGGIQNLFDYIQPITPLTGINDPNNPTGFSPYFDTAYAYAPIHGREFYLGVKWNLP